MQKDDTSWPDSLISVKLSEILGHRTMSIYLKTIILRMFNAKVKCKQYYWHLINNISYILKAISAWKKICINFKNKDDYFWNIIVRMYFACTRYTVIQTFQYKIIIDHKHATNA